MTAKENDLNVIRDLDSQLKEYKRKYEQAKTELRNVKGKLASSLTCPPNYNNPFNQRLRNCTRKASKLNASRINSLFPQKAASWISTSPLSFPLSIASSSLDVVMHPPVFFHQ